MEEAQPIGVFLLVSVGSSLLTWGLVLESFGHLDFNTSDFIVLEWMYSFRWVCVRKESATAGGPLAVTGQSPPSPPTHGSPSFIHLDVLFMDGLRDPPFGTWVEFAKFVHQNFGCLVSPRASSSPTIFHLVARVYGRSSIRLNEESMSLILQASLGGVANDFNIIHLSGWMFRFQCLARMLVSWFIDYITLLANPFSSFSPFGEKEVLTSEETSPFTAKNKRRNGPLLVPNQSI